MTKIYSHPSATSRPEHLYIRAVLLASIFISLPTLCYPSTTRATEDLVKCSDVIVLGTVKKSNERKDGWELSGHVIRPERVYAGRELPEFRIDTPGGWARDPNGRETFTTITSAIGGVRDGEEILAFLHYLGAKSKLRFLNKYGSKVLVRVDPESGERSVELRFLSPMYLSENALKTFDKLRKDQEGDDEVRARTAREQLKAGIVDTVPVEKLDELISRIIQDQGGPKDPHLICY